MSDSVLAEDGRDLKSTLFAEFARREAENSLAMQELCIRIARLRRRQALRQTPAEISADIVTHRRRAA